MGNCRGSEVEGGKSRVEGRMSRVASRGSEVEDRMSRVIGRGWESRGRQSKVQGQNLSVCMFLIILNSLRSRRYSRAQEEKLEIPLAQKLSILSSAHRAHGSAHTNVFALENQSERELLIMLLASLGNCRVSSVEVRRSRF